jgi:hypothetical protein
MEEIIRRYKSGESTITLSKEMGITPYSFRKKLKECGIIMEKRKGFKTNPKLKTDFFEKVDTEEKAYILGLMYSDGNVMPYTSKTGVICSYKLRIRLQESDHEILRRISKIMCGDDLVKILPRKEKNWSDIASFQIGNISLGRDIIRLGCPPNKSRIIRFPTEEQVPHELLRHFLRGFFDGDGSCTTKAPIGVSYVSNEIMCKQIREYFLKNDIRFADYYHHKNGYGTINMTGRDNCYKLYKFLYGDCSLYMERKRNTLINTIRMSQGKGRYTKEVLYERYPII